MSKSPGGCQVLIGQGNRTMCGDTTHKSITVRSQTGLTFRVNLCAQHLSAHNNQAARERVGRN